MRIDWVPFSAASLVAGASMLSVGALVMPTADSTLETLQLAGEESGRWLAVSGLYFVAAVALTVGLPAILVLFERRGARLGLTAVSVFTVGCVGLAGYAMVLALLRALVVLDAIEVGNVEAAIQDPGFLTFLYGWVGAFYLGELLLAVALFAARSTPRWIPSLLALHVALFVVLSAAAPDLRPLNALLLTVALSGVGISANTRSSKLT